MSRSAAIPHRTPLFHGPARSAVAGVLSLVVVGLGAMYVLAPAPSPSFSIVYESSPQSGRAGVTTATSRARAGHPTLVRAVVLASGNPAPDASASLVFSGSGNRHALRVLDPHGRTTVRAPIWARSAVVKVRESRRPGARVIDRVFDLRQGALQEVRVSFPPRRAPIVAPFYFSIVGDGLDKG